MTSVWELANPQLQDLAVYEPGKPIEETARELGVDPSTIIKLASNENPLGWITERIFIRGQLNDCARIDAEFARRFLDRFPGFVYGELSQLRVGQLPH